ncbi:MAG: galactokinase [Gammaproteobacteria bacterium]|nr:galactokinase [Gammaproteobacteria bacterium]
MINHFYKTYGENSSPVRSFFAPGRVNLIGDHTDYTGGKVFPCAIDSGTTLLLRPSTDGQLHLASTNFSERLSLPITHRDKLPDSHWGNYPLGVISLLAEEGFEIPGLELLYSGNIPNGAGLSSSASILVATAFALSKILTTPHTLIELAHLAQQAEWKFAGTQCGILDQFAVAMGKAAHAIELDCHSLNYRYVPLNLDELSLVVTNTNQRRAVSESAYNERVKECETALTLLQHSSNVTCLGEVSPELLKHHVTAFDDDPIALKRVRHIASENQRVTEAVAALENNDVQRFGELMNQSHTSLQQDFDVSSNELNALVQSAQSLNYVLGSRMTGAGFGGCTISLVARNRVEEFKTTVAASYREATNLEATFYIVQASNGVREVT